MLPPFRRMLIKSGAKAAVLLLLILLLPFGAVPASAVEPPALEAVTETGEHTWTCLYAGTQRQFSLYAPENAPTGILLMLHGYGSTGEDFRLLTKTDAEANARGYAIVYPTGAPTPEDPTSANGWNSGIGVSSSDDIGFLRALARWLQERYGLSRNETYAAGFSNGGFMMYRIALEGQDEFAAVAGVAAMMPEAMWAARPGTLHISVLQINGTKDDAVPMKLNGTDRYTRAPAIEDVIAYFADANGLDTQSESPLGTHAVMTVYTAADRTEQVRHVLITDGRHSWPEEKYCGFNVNTLILDFFDAV